MSSYLSSQYGKFNICIMICACICVYFSFYLFFGERGALKLVSLSYSHEVATIEHDDLKAARVALEKRVVGMRSETIDPDLLEERIQVMLGVVPENAVAVSF